MVPFPKNKTFPCFKFPLVLKRNTSFQISLTFSFWTNIQKRLMIWVVSHFSWISYSIRTRDNLRTETKKENILTLFLNSHSFSLCCLAQRWQIYKNISKEGLNGNFEDLPSTVEEGGQFVSHFGLTHLWGFSFFFFLFCHRR